jgi:integrase
MVHLKGVHAVKAKGRTYHYAWRGGPRLEGEPGSSEYLESYRAATSRTENLDRHRFGTWVVLYKESEEFRRLAETTREQWSKWLDRISDHFGKLRVRQFDRPEFRVDIRKWRDKWKSNPRTADYGKQVLSRVISFAVAEGKLTLNICNGIPNLCSADRSDVIWEEPYLEQLLNCDKVSPEIKWAARLARLTGFRKSDLLQVSWTHVGRYAIEIRTQKSKKKRIATAPITHELRNLLDEIPKRATTILTSSKRRPWTGDGFGSSWWKAMEDAGLHTEDTDLHLHDLRGTFATFIYGARFTVREIADTLGWTEDRVERLIDRYVRRDEILKDRIRRMEAGSSQGRG